jgi:hypothetical protein
MAPEPPDFHLNDVIRKDLNDFQARMAHLGQPTLSNPAPSAPSRD